MGEMLMVCGFFVCSLAQLRAKPLDQFWNVISQSASLYERCITLGVRTPISQFQGSKSPKTAKNRPE